jgi:hypothetical protein
MQRAGGAMKVSQKTTIRLLGDALLRAAKFAFAALLAGSRAIPLGDNSCVTRELGAYGARLRVQ